MGEAIIVIHWCVYFYLSTHLLIYHYIKPLLYSDGVRLHRRAASLAHGGSDSRETDWSPPALRCLRDFWRRSPASRARPRPPGKALLPCGSAGGRRGLGRLHGPGPRVRAEVRARAERERGLRGGARARGRGSGRGREGGEAAARRKRGSRAGARPGTRCRARRPLRGAGRGRAGGAGAAGRGLTPSAGESAPAGRPALASRRPGLLRGRRRTPHQ